MGDNQEFKNLDARALVATVDSDSGASPERKAVRLDPYTHAVLMLDYAHHEIHAGEHHFVTASTYLASGATLTLLVKHDCLPKLPNVTVNIDCALGAIIRTWGPGRTTQTFLPAGNIVPTNRNHYLFAATPSFYTAAGSFCVGAGGTETAPPSRTIHVGSTSTGGRVEVGGNTGTRNELIFLPTKFYKFEVVSRSANNSVTIFYDFYEHPPNTPYLYTPSL